MECLNDLIAPFVESVASGNIEIYNEFSLQHEFGIHLRHTLQEYKVQFERNVSFFVSEVSVFTKREIDISVFSPDKVQIKWAIELKFPRNGQYPGQMYSFCKDVAFTEELKAAAFEKAGLIILADDELFYRGNGDGIYGFFRTGKILHGHVPKPIGKKVEEVFIRGHYRVDWKQIIGSLKYAVIEVTNEAQ